VVTDRDGFAVSSTAHSHVDAARIDAHTQVLVLDSVRSNEVSIAPIRIGDCSNVTSAQPGRVG
jgi:hypothetical protein